MAETGRSRTFRRRVLVADDEPHIRRILATLLESAELEVDEVSDGAAALDRLLSDRRYDLVLLDIVMPRISGLEVLERVREVEERARLPIVILTSKGQDADRQQAFALGATEFVTKPFSPKKLLVQIDELLHRS